MKSTRNMFAGLMAMLGNFQPFQRNTVTALVRPSADLPMRPSTPQTERDLKSHQSRFPARRAYGANIARAAMKRGGYSGGRTAFHPLLRAAVNSLPE